MAMPRYYELSITHDFNLAHNNSVFKHELRSKASVVAYFDGLGGAGTVTFTGVEGTDYEFHAQHGFRTKSTTGAMKILISNILTGLPLQYLYSGGMSWEYERLTSEWIEPQYTPSTYIRPLPQFVGGAGAGAMTNTYLINFYLNTTGGGPAMRLLDNDTAGAAKYGSNRLRHSCHANAGNQSVFTDPITNLDKGTYIKTRTSTTNGCGAGWTDNVPSVTPAGGNVTTVHGERYAFRNATNQSIAEHTTGTCFVIIGNYSASGVNACQRWIRNFRLFNAPTSLSVNPKARAIHSMGDSYSATLLGPQSTDPTMTGKSRGVGGYAAYNESSQASLEMTQGRFSQLLITAGYQVGGMYGGGQGGKAFSTTLDSEGWRTQFIANHPSMVFTIGMHNDALPLNNGTMTLAGTSAQTITALQDSIMAQYILPVMQRGCFGWGFVVPPVSTTNVNAGFTNAYAAIQTMLLGLPAAWDAAYPEYAGKVKVRNRINEIGPCASTNINWSGYFVSGELTHLSPFGGKIAAEAFAEMALEWLRS